MGKSKSRSDLKAAETAGSEGGFLARLSNLFRGKSPVEETQTMSDAQGAKQLGKTLSRLMDVIESRKGADKTKSYVASRFAKGTAHCAKKVGEEGVEVAIAAAEGKHEEIVSESADLLFHLLILWSATGVTGDQVAAELSRREGTSGLTEKAGRKP